MATPSMVTASALALSRNSGRVRGQMVFFGLVANGSLFTNGVVADGGQGYLLEVRATAQLAE